jgi:UDP-N-acetyl-D-glucosamine dehydrogenase
MRDLHSPSYLTQLIERLETRNAVIAIIGLGYVGLPLSLRYAEAGFKVLGIDIDEAKVARLNGGGSYIEHIDPKTARPWPTVSRRAPISAAPATPMR